MSVMISLDTETTGLSFHHGARPFIVTTCDEGGQQRWWQWDVDPLTRTPTIPAEDVDAIQDCINNAELLVLQHSKFDAQALTSIEIVFPWHKVRDTLMSGHLLASNHKHNLTAMCVETLGTDIEPWEVAVEKDTKEARRVVKQGQKNGMFGGWRLAEEGDPMLPSVKSNSSRDEDKPWKNDMWLLRAIIKQAVAEALGIETSIFTLADVEKNDTELVLSVCDRLEYPHRWLTSCSEYANVDSGVTRPLHIHHEAEIRRRGLWNIYIERLKLLPIAFGMEQRGVTASGKQTQQLIREYSSDVVVAKQLLTSIAADHGHDLELPVGASPNDSLREMFFGSTRLICPRCATERKHKEWSAGPAEGSLCAKCEKKGMLVQCNVVRNLCLDLPKQYNPAAKSASPTLNSAAMDHYETTLDEGPALQFVRALKGMRSRQTAVSYAESYEKFWLPVEVTNASNATKCVGLETVEKSVSGECEQNGKLLAMDSVNVQQQIRPVPSSRGDKSSPGKLQIVQRGNTGGNAGNAPVRQPIVRKPGPSVVGNKQTELGGHGCEGKASVGDKKRVDTTPGTVGEGRKSSHDDADGGASPGNQEDLRQRKQDDGGRSAGESVQSEESNHLPNHKRSVLGPRRLSGWYRLHPGFNITGTDTIRWSSYNPNAQNISRKEDFNLRRCFGPMPGREWWSMDFKSIERRIPVYETKLIDPTGRGELKMLEVFEHPDKPPYWGNLYNLTASVLYPNEYWPLAEIEGEFRKRHPRLYKQSKFFDLAKQYGCGRKKGDLLSKVSGSFDKVDSEFPLFAALQRKVILFANKHGYVETIPDRLVDPEHGYPILVSRTENGHVSGTTPFNYHVSGTAMQTTNCAMVETELQVREWNEDGWDGFLTLQVHDELVWDCPRGTGSEPWRFNLPRMRKLAALMESCGERIGVPTPVSREYHATSWAEGISV